MSECIGEGCTHPDCTHVVRVPAPVWEPTGRADSAPPGVSEDKWRALSRAERREFKRRAARNG